MFSTVLLFISNLPHKIVIITAVSILTFLVIYKAEIRRAVRGSCIHRRCVSQHDLPTFTLRFTLFNE